MGSAIAAILVLSVRGRKLVALEYLVFVDAWAGSEPPALFGRTFDLVSSPNRYGLPPFYALHAWDLEAEPERHSQRLEPARRVRLTHPHRV